MPAFAVNMKHTPESCPMFNEELKKKLKELVSKREEIAEKHKVKVLSAYTSVLDHLILFIVEAPSQPAVEDYCKETGMAFWNNIEIRQVQLVEDVLKRL
jgi:hypothetical protein